MTATVGGNAPTPQQKTDLAQAFDLVRVNDQGQTIGPAGLVVGGGVPISWTFVGDSINFMGVRYGAQVSTGLAIGGGVNLFLASLYTNVAGTGSLNWDAQARALRYTAPGDAPGPWVPMTRTQRFRIPSANGLWLEGSFFADTISGQGSTTISVAYASPAFNATMSRGVPEWLRFLNFNRPREMNLSVPGAAIRHLPDILRGASARPGRVIVQIGTNDVIQARTPAQIEADFLAVAPTLAAFGAVVCSIPALAWAAQSSRNAWIAVNNTVVPRICAEYGIPFVNIWDATVDQSSTTAPKANRLQADNVHPAAPGAAFAALALNPYVSQGGVGAVPLGAIGAYDATNNPGGNLVGNPGFTGTGGAVSGTNVSAGAGGVPTGYTAALLAGTVTGCVVQLVPASDGGNPWVEFAITGASAGAELRLEHNVGVGSTVPTAGQAVESLVEWEYVAGSGGALRGVEARVQPVTVTNPIGYSMIALDSMSLPDVSMRGITPPPTTPWTMPSGATAVRHQALIKMSAGNATVRVRNPLMRIVS
jgi:lysophospholipase L1-like esterase